MSDGRVWLVCKLSINLRANIRTIFGFIENFHMFNHWWAALWKSFMKLRVYHKHFIKHLVDLEEKVLSCILVFYGFEWYRPDWYMDLYILYLRIKRINAFKAVHFCHSCCLWDTLPFLLYDLRVICVSVYVADSPSISTMYWYTLYVCMYHTLQLNNTTNFIFMDKSPPSWGNF